MANVKRDNNSVPCIAGVLNSDGSTVTPIKASPTGHFMLSSDVLNTGATSPGTMAEIAVSGTLIWSDVNNAKISDNSYTTVSNTDGGASATVRQNRISIVKSDGVVGDTNNASVDTELPATDTYVSFGSSSDLWGEIWSAEDINDSNFGIILHIRLGTFIAFQTSLGLRASNFGFSIPAGATIDGIVAEVEMKRGLVGVTSTGYVDHIRITIFYTISGGAINGGSEAKSDSNGEKTLLAVSNSDGETPVSLYANSNGQLLIKST